MNESWIKIFRKFREWEWYKNPNVKDVFLEILLTANFQDKRWEGIEIKRGQLVTSINSLFLNLNKSPKYPSITVQNIRTALDKLKSTNEITMVTTTKYTLITINKYDDYQETTKELTNDQQTTNKRLTTTKEYKNIRNKESNTYVSDTETFVSTFNNLFKSNYQVTSGRTKKITQRRKNYTLAQILLAVKNLSLSEFHTGKNDRGWIADPDFLINSDEKIDKWLNPPKTMNNKNISEKMMEAYGL